MIKKAKLISKIDIKIKVYKIINKCDLKKDLTILCRIIKRLKKIYSKEGDLLADF
ncbi:MAG: hypothetical protein ACRDA5_06650 [Clostridium sp.]